MTGCDESEMSKVRSGGWAKAFAQPGQNDRQPVIGGGGGGWLATGGHRADHLFNVVGSKY